AKIIIIKIKEVLVETYNSVKKVEKYYILLRRVYEIIHDELIEKQIDKNIILQMAIKTVNNSIKSNDIVFTLLVFEVYFKITSNDTSLLLIIKRIEIIRVITKKIRYLYI
ncbi:hypothetical protein BDZ45DRAFT_607573, partial [Acephala macrosclerotiorum]